MKKNKVYLFNELIMNFRHLNKLSVNYKKFIELSDNNILYF